MVRRCFHIGRGARLSPSEANQFWGEMKHVVWKIMEHEHQPLALATGCCISESGHILATRIFQPQVKSRLMLCSYSGEIHDAVLVLHDPKTTLALLKIEASSTFDYAEFLLEQDGSAVSPCISEELLTIGHSPTLHFSLFKGYLTSHHQAAPQNSSSMKPGDSPPAAPYRRLHNVLRRQNPDLVNADRSLEVFQIAGVDGKSAFWGSPVFTTTGMIVGLLLFQENDHFFAIAPHVLKEFCSRKHEH